MQEMTQGDEYEEELEEEILNDENTDESDENTGETSDTLFGLPKKVVVIGAALLVVLLLGVILIAIRVGKKSDEDVVMSPTGEDIQYTEVYDSSGVLIGSCDGIVDGYSISAEDGTTIGYVDSVNGTESMYDANSEIMGTYTPNDTSDEDYSEEEYYEDSSNGSIEDMEFEEYNEKLRKVGYTGDEIELAKSLGIDAKELIKRSNDIQEKSLKKRLEKVSDEKSKEFLKLYNNSMFCMGKTIFDSYDESSSSGRKYTANYIVNADYWKCPTYGYQLMIKCKIADETYAFYNVTPERWETLPEEGNIVLRINYTMYGTNNVNMYITSIDEIDTTDITVNALDNAVSLDQILQDNDSSYGDGTDEYDDNSVDYEYDEGVGVNEPW